MPAHLRSKPSCGIQGCKRMATCDLYNTWNNWQGSYCDRHKNEALRRLQDIEAEAAKQAENRSGQVPLAD